MSDRDELQAIVADALTNPQHGEFALDSLRTAARVLAAGYRKPRTITTAEELDALELRSVVLDSDGEPFELTDNGWRYWMYEESFGSLELSLPATVFHEGAVS